MEGVDFYNSAACLLGTVVVPDVKPPKLGLIQIPTSWDDLKPGSGYAKLTQLVVAFHEIITITDKCMKTENQYACFVDNCEDYVKAWGTVFGADLKCPQFDSR